MTEYPQHATDVERIKNILRNIPGVIIRENDDERGKGGFRFPKCFNGINDVEYVGDVYAMLADGRSVIFEVDGKIGHSSTIAGHKDRLRDSFFSKFGIATVRYNVGDARDLTEAYLMQDVEYAFRQLRKALLPTPNPLVAKCEI